MKKLLLLGAVILCSIFYTFAQTYNATVAKDGSGTHTTVAAAIQSAPTNSTTPYYILVKSGVYNEKDTVPTNRPNIVMVGENVLNTVIYYNDNANTIYNGAAVGTSGSSAFFVNGANFTAFNMTFQNNSGVAAGQAVAVNISGDKAAFRNCRFLGFQDVLYCKNSGIVSYFKNCYIEGTVDFIFGASTSWFDSCYIFCKTRNSTTNIIAAPNTAAGTSFGSPWGFVFKNCNINGASGMAGTYYLGRPWQNKPQAVYLECNMSDVINSLGWFSSSAGSATTADCSYGEYNSTGAGANAGSRASFSSQLTSLQNADYTKSNVLGSWDPCSVTNVCNAVDFPVATANFTGTQNNSTSAGFSWNMCWPLSMTYTLLRSNNGGAFTTVGTTTGSSSNYNYSTSDNSMPTGVNRYILQMTYNGNTYTSTDTITISNQPTLTTSVSSLSAFAQTIGSPSSQQNFTLTGTNLSADATITAPTSFQVSLNNSTWSSSVNVTQSAGSISATIIYVRLNAGSNGSYSGNVTCATTGGTTLNVAVSGVTSSAPAYVASLLQQWPLTVSGSDSAAVRATGITTSTYSGSKLFVSNNATTPAFAPYSGTFGLSFGPSTTTTSSGLWTTANNGPGGTLSRTHYLQFTISGEAGYGVRVDSLVLNSAFYSTNSNTRLAVVYSKSNFVSDSAEVTVGGTLNGSALGATAYGGFTNFILLANQTGGPTNNYRLPLNGSTGVTLTSGQTLTVRLYFACSSTGTPRHAFLKNVQAKGSVTAPAPTITSFTPTSQISGGSVVITGTNFSSVTAVTFGGTNATNYTVNSGTQITAVVAAGTSGDVSVTTASGTATLSGFTFQTPTTYYNVAGTDVTDVNNWGTNTDGTGTHPTNFTDNLQTFKIYNSGATMSGAWTVSGSNSKISVNSNSGVFNQTQAITGTVDVENDADLEVKTATAPTLGTLQAGCTVGYSGSIDQTITAANYANLILNGTGTRTFPTAVVGIAGQFTTNTYTTANAGSIISFNGTSPQTVPAFTYDSLITSNSNGCTTQGGGSNVVVNKGLNVLQNFTVDAGDNVQLSGSNGVSFTVASGKTLTVSGTLDNQSTGLVTLGSLLSSSSSATAANADSARFVVNSGGIYKINAAVTNAYFIAVGNYKPGSEIQVLQGAPRLPYFVGGNVTWNTTAAGTASIVQQASNTINGNFNIMAGQFNNGTGGTARALTINGNLNVSGGEYDVNGNVTGTSAAQILTVNGDVNVTGGKLYPTISTNGGSGTINIVGNLSVTVGNFANATGSLVGNNVVLQGSSAKTATGFTGNALSLTINNSAGVTFSGNVSTTNLTLTNGVANMGSNTMTVSNTVSRTNGWVNGKLSKMVATGSNVTATFDIGDATTYLPVSMTFASVSTGGNIKVSTATPISSVANFGSAYVSPIDYVNRYWNIENVNTLAFTSYSATLNYKAGDIIGSATPSSVLAYVYSGGNWTPTATTAGTTANTINNVTALGNIIVGNDCTPVTPSVSISTASTTVCTANSVTFTATGINPGTAPVYQWKKNGANVSTGTTATFAAGTLTTGDMISCVLTANNICQTTAIAASNVITLTVQQSPAVATISSQYGTNNNSFAMCTLGGMVSLYPSLPNGVWSSNGKTSVVRPNATSYSANATAIQNGVDTIRYTITTPGTICTSVSKVVVTVAQQATPNAISGATTLCVGSSTTFSTSSMGGVWSTTGRASVTSAGVATGTSAGTTSVKYTITNASGCSASATYPFTVYAQPSVPSIAFASGTTGVTGTGGYCKGKTFTLVGSPTGGNWSSSGVISVNPVGVVNTGAIVGVGSVTYTVTNVNGCTNSRTISANIVNCGSKGVLANTSKTESLTVFPNPAKTICNVKVDGFVGNGTVVVTNLYGKQIKQFPLSIGSNIIDLNSIAKGVYFVSVITEQGKQTQKLIVE